MSLKPETITQIQTMLQTDPVLLAQVQSSADVTDAVAILAKAAAVKGIEISPSDLMEHFETAARQGAMSDAELEQVSGGGLGIAIALSIVSVGIACAVLSANAASNGEDCATRLIVGRRWTEETVVWRKH